MNPLLGIISRLLSQFKKNISGDKSKKEQIYNPVVKDARYISELGWRQGSILPTEMVKNLPKNIFQDFSANLNDSDLIFAVSHDCDITNSSFENEPKVELMIARAIAVEHIDYSRFCGRNPRKFQFTNSSSQLYEISIHDKIPVDRTLLLNSPPDNERTLPKDLIRQICLWISKRYFRSAFPDSFNFRINKKVQKAIQENFKKNSQNITAVYLLVTDDELLPEVVYEIVVKATMSSETYQDSNLREQSQKMIDILASRLNSCEGIAVLDSSVVSEAEISIDDLRFLKRWDYDYLSFGADTPDEIAPFL